MKQEFDKVVGRIKCPVCERSEVVVFEGARGCISLRCANCNRFVRYDLEHMLAEKCRAVSYQAVRRGFEKNTTQ